MLANSHQYSAKASGFRPPFAAQGGGSSVKGGQGSYAYAAAAAAAGAQKPSSTALSGAVANPTASPIGTPPSSSSQQDGSPSPSGITANHGQRQRPVAGPGQSAKAGTSRASASTLPSPPVTSHLAQVSEQESRVEMKCLKDNSSIFFFILVSIFYPYNHKNSAVFSSPSQ